MYKQYTQEDSVNEFESLVPGEILVPDVEEGEILSSVNHTAVYKKKGRKVCRKGQSSRLCSKKGLSRKVSFDLAINKVSKCLDCQIS